MAFVYKDRVQESSTFTGTGDITPLGGAPDATYKAFGDAMADGDTTDIMIFGQGSYESCPATYVSATNKLVRGTPYQSSNGNAAVNFGAGEKTIIMTLPASKALELGKGGIRERLTANRTYYVRTDGSDSNNGLANTSGGAFLTIQKAIDVAVMLDLSGFSVAIQVGAGTYTAPLTLKTYVGVGPITIIGDETTPSNVVISTTSANCVTADTVTGKWQIKGFKLTAATSGYAIAVHNGSVLEFGNLEFGAVVSPHAHIYATSLSRVTAISNYKISGGGFIHIQMFRGAEVSTASVTVTLTGTPAFGYYAYATNGSGYYAYNMTFVGSATGVRYNAQALAWIDTVGGGANYFPGNSAGSVGGGGQYI